VKFGVAVDDQFKGTITIAVYGLQQAAACYNFIELSKRPQGQGYNGTIFYRIFRNLLIEGGDFEANDGSGGKSAINNGTYPHNEYGLKHSKYSVSLASELK
jgi:peptidyl-prolyl cis-trans isomerase B (cyclophilin B)